MSNINVDEILKRVDNAFRELTSYDQLLKEYPEVSEQFGTKVQNLIKMMPTAEQQRIINALNGHLGIQEPQLPGMAPRS